MKYSKKIIDSYFKNTVLPVESIVYRGIPNYHRFNCYRDYKVADELVSIKKLSSYILNSKNIDRVFFVSGSEVMCENDWFLFKIGDYFHYSCVSIYDEIQSSFPVHSLHPLISIFIKESNNIYAKHSQDILDYFSLGIRNNIRLSIRIEEILTDFIFNVQKALEDGKVKKTINNYSHQSRDNYKNLSNYINQLFEQHNALLVLRVDVGYKNDQYPRKEAKITNQPINDTFEIVNDELIEVKNDLKLFFEPFLDQKDTQLLFKGLIGYVWKLDFSAEKGFCYRILFFYPSDFQKHEIQIANAIGEHWRATVAVAGVKGCYFNGNAHKQDYRAIGTGLITHDDTQLREELDFTVRCLTKMDDYVRLQIMQKDKNGVNKSVRTFGKGRLSYKPRQNKQASI